MAAKTSSDSNTFLTLEILWLIEAIKKDLIEIDLSESTEIDFLYFFIFFDTRTEKLLLNIGSKYYMRNQNIILSL